MFKIEQTALLVPPVMGLDKYDYVFTAKYSPPIVYFDGLVQERRNAIAKALALRLSCINASICRWVSARKK